MRDAMPRGWDLWEDKERAAKLNRALDVLEGEARHFVGEQSRTVAISLTRTRWDEPELELRWAPGEVHRSVLLTIQPPSENPKSGNPFPAYLITDEFEYKYNWKLKVSGAAWQDEDVEKPPGKRIRRWTSIDIRTFPFDDIQTEKISMRKVLTEAFEKVSALSLSDLSHSEVIPPRV